mgnify:FL=1
MIQFEVDVSAHQGLIQPATVDKLREMGIRRASVGTLALSDGRWFFPHQCEVFRAGGIEV